MLVADEGPTNSMFRHLTRGTQLMSIYIPYFYIIQDIRNSMYYAGSKYGKDANPETFMVEGGYSTSSEIINELIKTHGLVNFIIRKIKIFKTGPEAHRYETRFLQKLDARNHPKFYNGHNNDGLMNPEKMRIIMLERYGVEYAMQSPIIREKVKEISMEKYGVCHYTQSQVVKDKMVYNNKEKYGVANVFQADFVKDKIKETNLERYGVEHPSHSLELLEKKAQNNLEKYGVRSTFSIPEIRKKALENTWTEKARQKRISTNLEKYGYEVGLSSPLVIEKILETRKHSANREAVILLLN